MRIVLREAWIDFRDRSLSVAELENTRAAIRNILGSRSRGFLKIQLGSQSRRYSVFLYLSTAHSKLEVLGAHFDRPGEPSSEFQRELQEAVKSLQEEEHGHGA